ncbi:hypothetical protein PGT21_036029 [Puccinia graminis f. sp. tritici]|uniref:Uncharacterized protein n=1 Tax=Puccinia graminis f. sp. tritici TaxID=56615 RepID=A0A5B0PNE5_PUCGR|nr:hypothetical protein PGT21_036029 [Puccinia graminis f. sp. tritici]
MFKVELINILIDTTYKLLSEPDRTSSIINARQLQETCLLVLAAAHGLSFLHPEQDQGRISSLSDIGYAFLLGSAILVRQDLFWNLSRFLSDKQKYPSMNPWIIIHMNVMNASVWADDRGRITHVAVFLTLTFKLHQSTALPIFHLIYGYMAQLPPPDHRDRPQLSSPVFAAWLFGGV